MKYPELEFIYELPRQYEEIGRGGQAAVYMLTDPDRSQEVVPDELFMVPRVIKIALGSSAILAYVRDEIGITDPWEQKEKARLLAFEQLLNHNHVMNIAAGHYDLREWFGFPRPTWDMSGFYLQPGDTSSGITYTQDYGVPFGKLLDHLDADQPRQRQLAYRLVDEYIMYQHRTIPFGMMDTTFKLPANFCVNREFELFNSDFSEVTRDYDRALQAVETREWEQLPSRRESAPFLPGWLLPYFNEQMEQRLTPESIGMWGTLTPQSIDYLALMRYTDTEGSQIWLDHLAACRQA